MGEQTHYEVLEVDPGASPQDIERAYRVARSAYGEGSLAHYSVFDEGEAATILERIEQAFLVLGDPSRRGEYDQSLRGDAEPPPPPAPAASLGVGTEAPAASQLRMAAFDQVEDTEEDAAYDGASLRRIRMRRGVEIEQIADVTKVNPTYLRCIEEECFDELPAPVYVRGFVTAYAKAIRLDAAHVAARYMERFEAAQGDGRRPRLLGRR